MALGAMGFANRALLAALVLVVGGCATSGSTEPQSKVGARDALKQQDLPPEARQALEQTATVEQQRMAEAQRAQQERQKAQTGN